MAERARACISGWRDGRLVRCRHQHRRNLSWQRTSAGERRIQRQIRHYMPVRTCRFHSRRRVRVRNRHQVDCMTRPHTKLSAEHTGRMPREYERVDGLSRRSGSGIGAGRRRACGFSGIQLPNIMLYSGSKLSHGSHASIMLAFITAFPQVASAAAGFPSSPWSSTASHRLEPRFAISQPANHPRYPSALAYPVTRSPPD